MSGPLFNFPPGEAMLLITSLPASKNALKVLQSTFENMSWEGKHDWNLLLGSIQKYKRVFPGL